MSDALLSRETLPSPSSPPPIAPYKGLTSYAEDDAPLFFGRDAEREIIAANLLAMRLTVLYGASGVGKSSVLRAGVASHLQGLGRQNLAESGAPRLAVVVFDSWRDDPVAGLIERVEQAVVAAWDGRALPAAPPVPPQTDLTQALRHWTERVDGNLLIILDQFEEYFLYHAHEDGPGTFAVELPRAVNRSDLRVNVLIALREDALAGLDRFKGRIPTLFDNYLRVDHLDQAAARAAVEQPLAYVNRAYAADGFRVGIESALVDEAVAQVRTGQVVLDRDGRGAISDGVTPREARVETPYLQLVLTRLWDEEMRAGSRTLRLATLEDLGGAERIVRTHLDEAMAALPAREQDVAARVFRYLVAPSGTKVAYSVDDLAAYADVPAEGLAPVLEHLSGAGSRILRPVAPPPHQPALTRYEIFHDVLIPAILDWRARYANAQRERADRERQQQALQRAWDEANRQKEQAAAERRRAETQARTALRLRRQALSLALVSLLALGAAVAAFAAWQAAQSSRQQAESSRQAAVAARDSATLQARLATSRALAAQAPAHLGDQYDLALLLAAQATEITSTVEAKGSLLTALGANPYLSAYLNGHTGPVTAVAFSPHNATLASGSGDGTVILWDIATRRLLARLSSGRGGGAPVDNVAFSPDGKRLAVGNAAGTLRLWDVTTRRPLGQPLSDGRGAVAGLAYSPDGRILAAGQGRVVVLWDIATRRPAGQPLVGATRAIASVAFSPDGRTLAVVGGRSVVLWDVATRRPVGRPFRGHTRDVSAVAFSPDGTTLAAGSADRTIILWDVASHQRLGQVLSGHQAAVTGLAFSPDGNTLISSSNDATLRLWDVALQQPLIGSPPAGLTGHTGAVGAVAFSPDGTMMASGGTDHRVILWHAAPHSRIEQSLPLRAGALHNVVFSLDGHTLATGGDNTVWLWDTTRQWLLAALHSHRGTVFNVALSPDGHTLAIGSATGHLQFWDLATRRPLGPAIAADTNVVNSVVFSPDGGALATGSLDGVVRLWDVATRRQRGPPLLGRAGEVWSVAFSPDGRLLASSGRDHAIRIWNVATHRLQGAPLVGHTDAVWSVTFSPDGRMLASASWDNTVRLWDTATGRPLGPPLTGHSGSVDVVRFSPDGRTLASGSQDGTVILWDVATHQRIGPPLYARAGAVWSVAFSPDGATLASVGPDGTVRLWDTSVASWRRRACAVAGRDLTPAEWSAFVGTDVPYRSTCAPRL